MFAKPVEHVAERQPAYGRVPSRSSETSGLRPGAVGKIDDNGRCRASHDDPSKRLLVRWIDFHMREKSGDMNKISGLCTRDRFSSFAPTDLADARKNVRDGLLFPVMMNSRPGSWFHFKQPAPDGRRNTERRCNRRSTLGTGRLCGSPIELARANDVNCSGRAHGVPDQFGFSIEYLGSGLLESQ
jgi:hypothetical protein